MRHNCAVSKGFTLIEMMVALVILETVLVISVQAISSYLRWGRTARPVAASAAGLQGQWCKVLLASAPGAATEIGGEEDADVTWQVTDEPRDEFTVRHEITAGWKEYGTAKSVLFVTETAAGTGD